MEQKEMIAKQLALKAAKEIFEGMNSSDKKKQELANILILVVLSVGLLILGSQSMLVIFRTNFGTKIIKKWAITLASLSFIGWGGLTYVIASNSSSSETIDILGGELACYFTSIFYLSFGILSYFIGLNEVQRAKLQELPPYYTGDSVLLSFIDREGNNQNFIQKWAEPLIIFAVALFFTAISPLLSFPIFYCFLSLVIHNVFYGVQPKSIEALIRDYKPEPGNKDSEFTTVSF